MPPSLPSRIGKTTTRKKIDGTSLVFTVEVEEVFAAPSNPDKAFCLQKLKFADGEVGYRFSYYMIAHKPRMKGKWAFGQFAPMMTAEELKVVFEKIKAKGWID